MTNFGFRLRGNAQAIDTAVNEAGQLNADRQRREVGEPVRSPALIAFDSEGRMVESFKYRKRMTFSFKALRRASSAEPVTLASLFPSIAA